MAETLKFPQNFLWGAATSAHQIEGGNNNDWTVWEKENAQLLAKKAEKQFSQLSPVWQEIKIQAKDPKNYISGRACGHYHLYKEDFALLKKLNLNAFRLSLEWSRIEPKEGEFNQKEIEHYRKVLKTLKESQIKVFVTLHHFTNPLWLKEKGGWASKKVVFYFSRFAKKAFDEYQGLVDFWITINEPLVYATHSFLLGLWPPQKKSFSLCLKVVQNQIKAHKQIYQIFKRENPGLKIGIAKHNIFFEPFNPNSFLDRLSALSGRYFWNEWFCNKIKDHQDFLGLNYYFHSRKKFPFKDKNENKIVSDLGWELYPQGIYDVLKQLQKYRKPLYITENGLADRRDSHRAWFIQETLKNVHRVIQEGGDVRGYLHWSLLDNFEWDKGFWPRFGLVEVDYENLERKMRPSAFYYAQIAKQNQFSV